MTERSVPWWRRALSFALGTIRSGFGLFRQNGNREAGAAASGTTVIDAHRFEEQQTEPEEQEREIEEPGAEAWVISSPVPQELVQASEPVVPEFAPEAVVEPATEIIAAEVTAPPVEPPLEETPAEIEFVQPSLVEAVEPPLVKESIDPVQVAAPEEAAETKRAAELIAIAIEPAPESDIPGEIPDEPSIETNALTVEHETPSHSEPAEESTPSTPDALFETTEPTEAASAEDMPESIETAPQAASEIADDFERQASEEVPAADGTETPLLEPQPAPTTESPLQETAEPVAESAPEEARNPQPVPAFESASAQAEELVPSEEVNKPIESAAEASPEAATNQTSEVAAKSATKEATEPQMANDAVESSGAESASAPVAGLVEPPPAPLPPMPEPPPIPAPDPPQPLPGPEPAPLPAPVPVDAAPTLPFAEKTTERTTAEKVAAALKAREARGEDADRSPFSVLVNEVYDGPLDLLLDLIRKQDIDIYDIPIAKITAQFLAYVDRLRATDMDVAGEFIYTAALLIHIKSKMLLPRAPAGPDDAAEDPRRELVERLLEHERFKNAAQMLHEKQMLEAATWTNPGVREFKEDTAAEPEIAADTTDLVRVFSSILERARNRPIINVEEDSVTVGQMIQFLARRLTMEDRPVALRRMLSHTNSERALIAMFLALLELVRLQAILLRQDRHFSEIFIKKHTGFDALMNQGLAEARDDWR